MGNLGFILIGIGDVFVAGRHSTDTFAEISIANAILNCILTFGIGLVASISPLLSNYRGEKKAIKRYFYPSIRFAMILAFITCILILVAIPVIPKMGFEQKLVPGIQQYMFITAFSTFGAYLHASLKEFLQAFEIVVFPNAVTIFCVFLNIALNVLLVFGWGPIPSLGVIGLAIASFTVRYFMGIALLIYCYMNMRFSNYHERGYYKHLLQIGMPISLAVLVEFVAFNSIAIFMGRVSGVYAAAQNLVCSLTTVSFMVPIMYILSIFQVFDGLQVALAGICKGIKQTNIVLLANFLAYWCVSIPVGYTLAFKFNFNLKGFWLGLVFAAVILCAIMIFKLKKYYDNTYKNKNFA